MAEWSRNKVNSSDLNNGNEFNSNDRVARQELNAIVNAGLYAQDFAEHLADTPDTSEINNVGTPSVTFIDNPSATTGKPYKRFKLANLKGEQGVGVTNISSGTATTSGEMTTTPVTFTLSNNSTQTINVYAQKGEAGQNGTTINVNNIPQSSVNFDSDPQAQIDAKVDKIDGKQLSTNDYTTEEKNKLAGIQEGAEVNPAIDSILSTTSTNAVQNKVVTEALNNKTTVNISNVAQDSINFTSDPQTQLNEKLDTTELLNKIYPIGSIYISVNQTSPASFIGGTWQALDEGRTLWTTTTAGQGGTTVSAGLPNIEGSLESVVMAKTYDNQPYSTGALSFGNNVVSISGAGNGWWTYLKPLYFNANDDNDIYGNSTTVQPPAYRVYMWRRTA